MSNRDFRYPLNAKDLEELKQAAWDIYELVVPTVTRTDGDYSTDPKAAWEVVVTTGTTTQTITLHSGAKDLHRVSIKRKGSGGVTIATEGSETIDGSSSVSLMGPRDGPNLYYDEDDTDWMII
jgi:hypothetical protein